MIRILIAVAALAAAQPALAQDRSRAELDGLIARHAAANGVPESLVRRVIVRESKYNAGAVGRGGTMGLMQIKHATARGVGYTGSAAGLLDADTNLTYAVRYLAGAYRAAGGNHDRAVAYYAGGYYYHAKRMGQTGKGYAIASAPAPDESDATASSPTPGESDATASAPAPGKGYATASAPALSKNDATASSPVPGKGYVTASAPASRKGRTKVSAPAPGAPLVLTNIFAPVQAAAQALGAAPSAAPARARTRTAVRKPAPAAKPEAPAEVAEATPASTPTVSPADRDAPH